MNAGTVARTVPGVLMLGSPGPTKAGGSPRGLNTSYLGAWPLFVNT